MLLLARSGDPVRIDTRVRSFPNERVVRGRGRRQDIGFTFFSLFCIGSTVASLGIRVSDREHFCFQALGRMWLGLDYEGFL